MSNKVGSHDDNVVRKMASLLKSGAAMLEQSCPFCNVPLFKLKRGEVVCPSCGQRFVIVSSDEEELQARGDLTLQELERAAVERLMQVTAELRSAKGFSEISETLNVALNLLRVIEYARRIRQGTAGSARG